jgi:hypothetical protein
MMLEIQVLAWDRHTNVAVLNLLMALQSSPLDNLQRQQIETNSKKPAEIHQRRRHAIT